VSNPMKLGFGVIGSIRIDADINKVVHITRELEKLKPIWFIVHTTGDSDIYTEFLVKSLDELNELIFEKISRIDGIIRTNTSIIIKFIKRNYQWGTGLY
jgi:Lrp/AsnC family transcriptional regulator for asnA, asnC and gidA